MSAPTKYSTDFCGVDGADRLKKMIESHWRGLGHEVRVYCQQGEHHSQMRITRMDVRSNMINGMPR